MIAFDYLKSGGFRLVGRSTGRAKGSGLKFAPTIKQPNNPFLRPGS